MRPHRNYVDGRVELLISLAIPNFDMFEVSPLCPSAVVVVVVVLWSSASLLWSTIVDAIVINLSLLLRSMAPRRVPSHVSWWSSG